MGKTANCPAESSHQLADKRGAIPITTWKSSTTHRLEPSAVVRGTADTHTPGKGNASALEAKCMDPCAGGLGEVQEHCHTESSGSKVAGEKHSP